jgi:ABC-type glycerol-3-phosphate transport system permease component
MIYTSRPELEPLQSVLRRVLIENQNALDDAMFADQMSGSGEELKLAVERANMAYTMKYAMVFIASAPLLAAYPFVQKHFVKGVMIGAVKE